MSGEDGDQDKSFEATEQKLSDARKKGDVPKSVDLFTASAYAGLFVAFSFLGQRSVDKLTAALVSLLDQAPSLVPLFFGGSSFNTTGGLLKVIFLATLPIFAVPAACVLAAVFAQRALVFAPSKLAPKLSRISIISNAKNKFGRGGLFEFSKSFLKLLIYATILSMFISSRLDEIISILHAGYQTTISFMVQIGLGFLFIAILVSAGIGFADAVWQHSEHRRKNRMSRKEVQDEQKNSEGDPQLKQERRQRALTISKRKMMSDIPGADVVIVNPTHYAIALTWSRLPGEAPVCVAKGVDEIAKAIRLAATEANVPIHSDPPTARALYATTDIGEMITPDHFSAVAAAVRFAEAMRLKARGKA